MRILQAVFVLTLAALVMAPPMAVAQAPTQQAVEKCTQQCAPHDPDVNGPGMKKKGDIVKVILYSHWEDILNMAPLNTQAPDAQREPDHNQGFLMPVLDTNTGTQADVHFKNNVFLMYSSPGLVEYLQEGWRTHQEPGLAGDAVIGEKEFPLYWYMSSHAVPNQKSTDGAGATAKVGVMPQVGVYARMETGRFAFRGTLIAESDDYDKNGIESARRTTMITTPNGPDVYEFKVMLNVKPPGIIPSAESANGFIVYINPYQIKTDQQNGFQIAQEEWRVRTGPKFPPRLVVPIQDTMQTKASSLSIFEDRLFVRWSFISVWGSYDMKDISLKLEPTGQGKVDPKAIDFIILKRSVDHDGHFKPVNATWAIDYLTYPLPDGDYELTASIPNLQETFMLEQKFTFKVVNGVPDVPRIGGARLGSGGSAGSAKSADDTPGFEVVGLAAALAVAVLVALRRRKA